MSEPERLLSLLNNYTVEVLRLCAEIVVPEGFAIMVNASSCVVVECAPRWITLEGTGIGGPDERWTARYGQPERIKGFGWPTLASAVDAAMREIVRQHTESGES